MKTINIKIKKILKSKIKDFIFNLKADIFATKNVRRLCSVKNCCVKIWFIVYKATVKMRHISKYVLRHPFRQDGHDRLNMDQQLPYFYTDNFFFKSKRF